MLAINGTCAPGARLKRCSGPSAACCSLLLAPAVNAASPLLQALLFVYPLLWLQLYLFLFRQRAKKLGPVKRANTKAE